MEKKAIGERHAFTIELQLSQLAKPFSERTYQHLYWRDKEKKPYYDEVIITGNKLIIKGCRSYDINLEEHLSSWQSNTRLALVKGLLLLYFRGCHFKLDTLVLNGKSQSSSADLQQRFRTALPAEFVLPFECLDVLFSDNEAKSQALLTSLMNLVLSLEKEQSFDRAWRAFNALYDYQWPKEKTEREQFRDTSNALGYSKELSKHMSQSFKALSEELFDDNSLYRSLLENIDYEKNLLKAERNYQDYYGTEYFSDEGLLRRFLSYYNSRFVAELSDKDARRRRKAYQKKMQAKISEKQFVNADYIYLVLSYIYGYRNAQFHGRSMVNDFLIPTLPSKELARLARVLQELCIAIIIEFFKEV